MTGVGVHTSREYDWEAYGVSTPRKSEMCSGGLWRLVTIDSLGRSRKLPLNGTFNCGLCGEDFVSILKFSRPCLFLFLLFLVKLHLAQPPNKPARRGFICYKVGVHTLRTYLTP